MRLSESDVQHVVEEWVVKAFGQLKKKYAAFQNIFRSGSTK
jgi:hypothetical protein